MEGWTLAGTSLLVMLGAMALIAVLRRIRRRRWMASIPADRIRLRASGVPLAIHAQRGALPNVLPGRINRDVADLALTDDRFLLVGNRGRLLDVGAGHGRRFRSVRCPAPDLLVIEGDRSSPSGPLHFRIEAALRGAGDWSEALQIYAEPPADGLRYAVRPPEWDAS